MQFKSARPHFTMLAFSKIFDVHPKVRAAFVFVAVRDPFVLATLLAHVLDLVTGARHGSVLLRLVRVRCVLRAAKKGGES